MTQADAWTARRSGSRRHRDDARSEYEIDYARVVHSSPFRRLQGKTQILALGDDDFYRTRLTHSLEVSQVAQGILQQLRVSERADGSAPLLAPDALIAAIALAHDLGHPPFGHGGELALNYCMRDAGGFEGNAQTLRILSRLDHFSQRHGSDLTRRALLGILKYPVPRSAALNAVMQPRLDDRTRMVVTLDRPSCVPPKAFYDEEADVVEWIFEPFSQEDRDLFVRVARRDGRHGRSMHKSFDCSVMDVADDVAYGVHDLEDAIAIGLIDAPRFREALSHDACEVFVSALAARPLEDGSNDYEGFVQALFGDDHRRKKVIGRLVHFFLRNVSVARDLEFGDDLLASRAVIAPDAKALLDALQKLVVEDVIEHPRVQHLEFKGQRMVVSVFEALLSDPRRLLPASTFAKFEGCEGGLRVLSDHVAAMTDGTLLKTYERLFSPRMGSVFDRH